MTNTEAERLAEEYAKQRNHGISDACTTETEQDFLAGYKAGSESAGPITGETSDGYHTFNELYRHRHLLFLLACKVGALKAHFVVEDHFPGWDLIVAFTPEKYEQVSYHIPYEYRELYMEMERQKENANYDGHTSLHVLERLFHAVKNFNWDKCFASAITARGLKPLPAAPESEEK